MTRLPPWIRSRISANGTGAVTRLLERFGLNTVCESAACPNRHECFGRGTATFMLLGNVCTRDCAFCAVANGVPLPPDAGEPRRVAEAAAALGLEHVIFTSVTRDDLPDGGAGIFSQSIAELRDLVGGASVEVLTPDFKGDAKNIATVLDARPDVFNHNVETVSRLQQRIRPSANYARSMRVLETAAAHGSCPVVKSGLMVGLGETDEEIYETMADLVSAGCNVLTVGQYLAPSSRHAPVARYIEPAVFEEYGSRATAMGFKAVAAGPLVRSSYRAEKLLAGTRGKDK